MLLRFEVSNYRSILGPVELSMIAVDEGRPSVRPFELIGESVLTTAGIYGPNASGKSNVVEALAWLSDAAATSLSAWDEIIPREPFRFGEGPQRSTEFTVDMEIGGVRHTYTAEIGDSSIEFEGLYSYPERRRRVLFEREGMELTFRRGLGLTGAKELLTRTTLALSAAARLDDAEVRAFWRALTNVGALRVHRSTVGAMRRPVRQTSTQRLFIEQAKHSELSAMDSAWRDGALALLRLADPGIESIRVVEGELTPSQRVRLVHRAAEQELEFGLDDESEGTRTWFGVIGPILAALHAGQVVLFDEIDASLHPKLSAHLLELFQDPVTNPLGAQLIFTTHDTSLLNHLNRDEVWLTEKGSDGATTLTALADYGGEKVRRSVNLERAYLQGRFGAVPGIDQAMLRDALGLIRPAS